MFAKHCALVLERVIVYRKRESCLEKAKDRRKLYIKKERKIERNKRKKKSYIV